MSRLAATRSCLRLGLVVFVAVPSAMLSACRPGDALVTIEAPDAGAAPESGLADTSPGGEGPRLFVPLSPPAPVAVMPPPPPPPPSPPPPPPPEPWPRACPDVFDDAVLNTYELEVSEQDWLQLEAEFALIQARTPGPEVWHPAIFRFGDEVYPDAMIRVRGNSTTCGNIQLAIAFNKLNDAGRFHGMRRMDLDHGGCRLLNERLALSFMRDLGIPASCAAHVKLNVNGAYHGLFLQLEHKNKDFLKRNFEEDDGNLYKYGYELTTNEETGDTSDVRAFWAATDLRTLASMTDLDEAIREWAAEAVLPARDNYWLTDWNYYLYHHPSRGFLFLPHDLDKTFPHSDGEEALETILPPDFEPPSDLVMADPVWREKYLAQVREAIAAFDVTTFERRIDRWWSVIRRAAAENPYHAFDDGYVSRFKSRVEARAAWLRAWSPPPPPPQPAPP